MKRRTMLKGLGIGAAGTVGIPGFANIALARKFWMNDVPSFPEITIKNGLIRAKVYLPHQEKGYYRSTRFDWSGVISSLEYKGHSFFGEWFEKHDPKINDAITGPVEEFNPIGYEEAKPGDTFLKIGVGVLRKADDVPYRFALPFEVVDYGQWFVSGKKDQVEFVHHLTDPNGHSYHYQKGLKLVKGKAELIVDHTLLNTGTGKIETKGYNHNFFILDNQKIGPGYTVTFPFDLSLVRESRGLGSLVEIRENRINYLKDLEKGESAMLFLGGFSRHPEDYDNRIENSHSGAGVRITCDQPISDLAFWSIYTTLCPEPYIKIDVDPGKEFSWQIKYEFYSNAQRSN
ncbi:hypothetical protein [Aquiflexum sp.]|uniref:hypothetical protein n=1 Tax=Aquiflexum sp. TaxID=1872584 RepID=UPI003593675E